MRLLPFPSSHVGSAWFVLAALVAGAEPVAVRSVESIPVPSSETRFAVLFLGSELKIKDEAGQWRQISAADGKSFATLLPGEAAIRVELAAGAFEFTYQRALKLAAGRVEISNFEVTPGFSAARDPGRRWLQSQSLAASGVMDQERSANLRAGAEVVVGRSLQAVATNPNLSSSQKDQSMREIEGSAAPQTSVDPTIPRLEMGNHVEIGEEGGSPWQGGSRDTAGVGHDAVEINFTIKPRQNMEQPCVIVYAEFSVPDDVRRRRRVFAEALPPVDAGVSRKVRMSRSEFPVGFTELAVSVSFFDRGLELATDDAERRTDLTRAEARQFAVLEHVSKYRDAGRAAEAALVRELVDDALRSAWRRSGRTCFVRVTPDGGAEGIFEDVMGQQAIHDPVLVDLVAQLVFRPAVAADGGILSAMVQLRAGAL